MRRGATAPAGAVRIIAVRELGERLGAKSFYALTAILVLVIVAIGVATRFIDDDGPGAIDVGLVGTAPTLADAALPAAAAAFEREVAVTAFDDVADARRALEAGEVDLVLLGGAGEVLHEGDLDQEAFAVVQQAWAADRMQAGLRDAGLSDDEVQAALAVEPLTPVAVGDEDGSDGLATLTGTFSAILLFITLQTFGAYVLTGVVEEKSTAMVELLLVRVRADQLLVGKVIGIGIAAMVQLGLAVAATLVSLAISGVEVPGEIWSAVPMVLVWFLGGYALYSTLYALAGSLVSRQEDAQAASAPIMTSLLGAYLLVFVVGYTPESTVSRVLSVLPPIAPLLMPMRMAAGAASVLEITLALVLLVAAIVAAWRLTGKIFEQVLLRRGTRIAWRDALALVSRG